MDIKKFSTLRNEKKLGPTFDERRQITDKFSIVFGQTWTIAEQKKFKKTEGMLLKINSKVHETFQKLLLVGKNFVNL